MIGLICRMSAKGTQETMRQSTLTLNYMLLACIGLIYFGDNHAFAEYKNNPDGLSVDFRYMPPEWQTSICLPDDPYKSIVDKSGDLLYHYRRIVGGTDRFHTRIGVRIANGVVWKRQQLHSPRVPIVRTFLTANGLEVMEEAFAVTEELESTAPTGQEGRARNDLILVHITNSGAAPNMNQFAGLYELDVGLREFLQRRIISGSLREDTLLRIVTLARSLFGDEQLDADSAKLIRQATLLLEEYAPQQPGK
jgi:hypothetical protein